MKVDIYLDREDQIKKLVIDGNKIDRKVRFKIVFNYWIRDKITIHQWDNGYKKDVTFEAFFQIIYSSEP